MRAVGFKVPGGVEVLEDLDLPEPTLRARDLLVRVRAVSVNPVDVKQRAAARPKEGEPRVLGYDAAGVVEKVGSDVTLFRKGDEVFYAGTILRPGTNAELHAVDERIVSHKPKSLDFSEAAAMPLTTVTAWELLFDRLRVPFGDSTPDSRGRALLIINGAGGVGSILTQLARRLTGLTVITTASRPETIEWTKKMGAHDVIDHRQPLQEGLSKLGIKHVPYIAGLSASDKHHAAIVASLSPHGHFALIDDPKSFDIVPFKGKSLSVHWEAMFTRSIFETPDMIEQHRLLEEVAALVDSGVLRTTLTERAGAINAENLRKVHAKVEQGVAIGKTVLEGF